MKPLPSLQLARGEDASPTCPDPGWLTMGNTPAGGVLDACYNPRLSGTAGAVGYIDDTGAVYQWVTGVGWTAKGTLPGAFVPGGFGAFLGGSPSFPIAFYSDGAGVAKTLKNDSTTAPRFNAAFAPMPTPRSSFAAGFCDTQGTGQGLFVLAGGTVDLGGASNVTERYDVASDTWATGATMPATAGACAGFCPSFSTKLYVWASTGAHYIYDIVGNSWTTGPAAPFSGIGRPCANQWDTGPNGSILVGGGSGDDWWAYDTTTGIYVAKPASPSTGLVTACNTGLSFLMGITAAGVPEAFSCDQSHLPTFATP